MGALFSSHTESAESISENHENVNASDDELQLTADTEKWITIKSMLPIGFGDMYYRSFEYFLLQSRRHLIYIAGTGFLYLFHLIDLFKSEGKIYELENLELSDVIEVYLLDDDTFILIDYNKERCHYYQHYIELDHERQKMFIKLTYYYRIEGDNFPQIRTSLMSVNNNVYIMIPREVNHIDLLPYNPCITTNRPKSVRITVDSLSLAEYTIKPGSCHAVGSKIYFFLLTESLRCIIDRIAVLDLADYDLTKGNSVINTENCNLLTVLDLRKINFEDTDDSLEICNYFHGCVYFSSTEGYMYVISLIEATVRRFALTKSEYECPMSYGDSTMLIRSSKTDESDIATGYSKHSLQYRIIPHNVPTLTELCQQFIIKNHLVKKLSEKHQKTLFPTYF